MFNSAGLFKDVCCPEGSECALVNCIFSHAQLDRDSNHGTGVVIETVHDPISAPEDSGPPLKRRRLSSDEKEKPTGKSDGRLAPVTLPVSLLTDQAAQKKGPGTTQPVRPSLAHNIPKTPTSLASIDRKVSPPPSRCNVRAGNGQLEKQTKHHSTPISTPRRDRVLKESKESLIPRLLAASPAPHPVRLAVLKKLHEQLKRLNDQAQSDKTTKRELVLSEGELIAMALDEEEAIGKENPQIYKNVIGHRIQRLKKMELEEWKEFVMETMRQRHFGTTSATDDKEKTLQTGLDTKQEIAILPHILTPLKGLESHGYVTASPSTEDIKCAEQGVVAAGWFERCERCDARFQVFPGRNSDETSSSFGRLTSTEHGCTYHWSKPFRPPKSKTGSGEQEPYFPCCGGVMGRKGCTQANDHVFKVNEAKRLASILQFETTPTSDDRSRRQRPVTFDCEMGYTTMGLELIRLTAVSWPLNKDLLDVLVRPLGEVIDYNTRFSGVSEEQFVAALPYRAEEAQQHEATLEDGEQVPERLRVVESPMAARKLLFDLITPETPLIGHGIENDLNTCRVIHPTIVDTILLFPHPRGLPIRYGLKTLTSKYLQRSIQTGGGLGHDSQEDAKATGDLVRFKVAEKWKDMKLEGWRFEESKLIPPPTMVGEELGVKKGLKRPVSQLDGKSKEGHG
jgi:DNA polymerase III epsilon subunit-like protein